MKYYETATCIETVSDRKKWDRQNKEKKSEIDTCVLSFTLILINLRLFRERVESGYNNIETNTIL